MSFSERYGYRDIRSAIQYGAMDNCLRAGLWNVLAEQWIPRAEEARVYRYFFKQPVDMDSPDYPLFYSVMRTLVLEEEWHLVYDLLEYAIADYRKHVSDEPHLADELQQVMEQEKAGYRLVEGLVVPITSEEELAAIEEALCADATNPVRIHLEEALAKLSERQNPDYRNSIKESISAVEALCRQVTKDDKATLGKALGLLGPKGAVVLHKSLRQALDNLYGYTSDADGIRHAMMDEPDLSLEDAKFMLAACAAFVNYVTVKATKAGLELP